MRVGKVTTGNHIIKGLRLSGRLAQWPWPVPFSPAMLHKSIPLPYNHCLCNTAINLPHLHWTHGACTQQLGTWALGSSNYSFGFGKVYDQVLGPLGLSVHQTTMCSYNTTAKVGFLIISHGGIKKHQLTRKIPCRLDACS